jgi:hypothetical protein
MGSGSSLDSGSLERFKHDAGAPLDAQGDIFDGTADFNEAETAAEGPLSKGVTQPAWIVATGAFRGLCA